MVNEDLQYPVSRFLIQHALSSRCGGNNAHLVTIRQNRARSLKIPYVFTLYVDIDAVRDVARRIENCGSYSGHFLLQRVDKMGDATSIWHRLKGFLLVAVKMTKRFSQSDANFHAQPPAPAKPEAYFATPRGLKEK
jgi:hypothetical protein